MIGSIVAKLADALSMFWQALDYSEQKIVLLVGIYVAVVTVGMVYRVFVALMAEDVRRAVVEGADAGIAEKPATAD